MSSVGEFKSETIVPFILNLYSMIYEISDGLMCKSIPDSVAQSEWVAVLGTVSKTSHIVIGQSELLTEGCGMTKYVVGKLTSTIWT
jgi:hypothetical protein